MFGLDFDQVVTIDRITGTVTHLYNHDNKEQLAFAFEAGAPLEIRDAQGDHRYPPAAVLGLHFGTVPNTSQCRVQLWENPNGLYLVDPFDDDQADQRLWPIRPSWLNALTTFRTLAARLCEQSLLLPEVAGNGLMLSATPRAVHVATWCQQGARVEVEPEAGPRAQKFIGADDFTAQPRT